MVAESPTLSACLRGLHDRREAAPAGALAEVTGADAGDIAPRTAAALLGGVHRSLFTRIQELTLAGHENAEIAEILAEETTLAFDLVEPALTDYAVACPSPESAPSPMVFSGFQSRPRACRKRASPSASDTSGSG